MRDDCCDLALTMQAHGMLAFLRNRGASAITVLAEDTAVANAALAVLAAARAADLAGIDRSAVRVQFPGSGRASTPRRCLARSPRRSAAR